MEYLAASLMTVGSALAIGGLLRLNHIMTHIGVAIALLFTPISILLVYCVRFSVLL